MEKVDDFSCYTNSESRTGGGQLVKFTCRPEDVDQVKEFLKKICKIDVPTTGRITVSNYCFGKVSRYEIIQHKYAGGGCGYVEVLEIKNPPDGRCGIVINEYQNGKSVFTEWETVENACNVFANNFGRLVEAKELPKLTGFKRRVDCDALTPWFYAIGDEELIGDYTFPYGFQDDPVYRFGRKFVVFGFDGVPEIKVCMGSRFLERYGFDEHGRSKKYYARLVYWKDGGVWWEAPIASCSNPPRPLEEGEKWIVEEAVKKFRELLSGMKDKFNLKFTTGDILTCAVKPSRGIYPEGRYDLKIIMKDGEVESGYVDFKPKPESSNLVQRVVEAYKKQGKEVEKVEIVGRKTRTNGKKWAGVFYSR